MQTDLVTMFRVGAAGQKGRSRDKKEAKAVSGERWYSVYEDSDRGW